MDTSKWDNVTYEEKKAELEATYLPEAAAVILAKWLEICPDKKPGAKKVEKKAPKEEKPAEKAEE